MGIYPITCPSCSKLTLWFSGDKDQRCTACIEAALKRDADSSEVIRELKEHVELLTAQCADLDADKANLEDENDDLKHQLDRYKKALKDAGECGHGMLQTRILELEDELAKKKAELWVAKDAQLRTYDGLAFKADKADEYQVLLTEVLNTFISKTVREKKLLDKIWNMLK